MEHGLDQSIDGLFGGVDLLHVDLMRLLLPDFLLEIISEHH